MALVKSSSVTKAAFYGYCITGLLGILSSVGRSGHEVIKKPPKHPVAAPWQERLKLLQRSSRTKTNP